MIKKDNIIELDITGMTHEEWALVKLKALQSSFRCHRRRKGSRKDNKGSKKLCDSSCNGVYQQQSFPYRALLPCV